MILSFNIPEWCIYQRAALELLEVERNLASRQNSKSVIDEKLIASLIKKRDRLRCEVAPLKAAADAAERRMREQMSAPAASLSPARTASAASVTGDGLDIPAFLRRQA